MKRFAAALIPAVLLTTGWFAFGQEIHLKTRTIRAVAQSGVNSPTQSGVHQIVQFDHSPSVEDLDALLTEGHPVVSALPDNAVVVAGSGTGVMPGAGVRWVGSLDPADKVSGEFAGLSNPLSAVVEFHPDVSRDVQDLVAASEGVTLAHLAGLISNHAVVSGSMDQLKALAVHDEVAYIFPADPDLASGVAFNACTGMLTMSGPVAQYANIVHGWDFDSDHVVHLGYVFGSITPKVPAATVRSEVVRALNEWSKVTNVAFQPGTSASAPRTVVVKFASGSHGDSFPFDGPGGILAHTFYPVPVNPESIAGDMHLDADENWHTGADLDIYSVALHEAGHALGLGHSDKPGDVMYPYYRTGMKLSANDIGAVQALYGAPAAAITITAPAALTAAPSVLHLTLDASGSATSNAQTSLTGSIAGGVAPVTVQWQTDHGYSGQATAGSNGWMASGIPLVNGSNTVSITAFDASRQTATQTTAITFTPPAISAAQSGSPGKPVSITITSPSLSVATMNAPAVSIGGTATGGSGVTRVTWQSSGGASGTAIGTQHWIASNVPLLSGTNTIVVRAYDANGVNGWAGVVVVRH